ncbi:glycosyltransferase family 41 protein [Cyanobium sp. NIES-981]|uniref:O-linked N-acetylglucosamine transferase, SPINDLY family protein n=1 Tax=Cyanobium sp. NIES-981 TaxID=1851505 RepID=UPI0007DDA497
MSQALGALLQQRGDLQGASEAYQQALQRDPANAEAADQLTLLARQLRHGDQAEAAEAALRAVLRAAPRHPAALFEAGVLLMGQARFPAARACLGRLVRLEPRHRDGLFQYGQVLEALGDPEAAIAAHVRALQCDPSATDVLVHLQVLRLRLCDWHRHHERLARMIQRLEQHASRPAAAPITPLRLLSFPLPLALQRRLAERYSASTVAPPPAPPLRAAKALSTPPAAPRQGRIRLGYLSADFRHHAMGTLLHGLFRHHDRERFEVFAYSLADLEDAYTASVRQGVDTYTVVCGWSNGAIADRIRADRIDVLIDLMGHTHHGRPAVLAQRPAPLQLHYLGYPGSLGASWIDGLIADAQLIPVELEHGYSEPILRLPWGFVSSPAPEPCDNVADGLERQRARQRAGLPAKAVVFACFNRPEKLDPDRFSLWLAILLQVPGSVLWLLMEHPLVRQRLRQYASAAGVDPARIVFGDQVGSGEFSALCSLADLFLDTACYGSGATAVAALAAGLPLLTCPGESFSSRMGTSLCAATGLDELICPTPEAYRERAIALGRNPQRLRQLSRHLLSQQATLPLFQTSAWVREFELLLLRLVNAGLPAEDTAGCRHHEDQPGSGDNPLAPD